MKRGLTPIALLILLPPLMFMAPSCGGQSPTSNQQPAQLSPEDQARQTVTDFLEMCKNGQVQEAIDKYRDATSDFSPRDTALLQNIVDYSIRDATLEASPTPPPYIVVALDVTVRQESISGEAGPEIRCSQDGSRVLGGVEYSIQ